MYRNGGLLADYSFSKFIEPVKGLWLPTFCRRLSCVTPSARSPELEMLLEVKSVAVNQVTDRDFDLELPAGTRVIGLGKGFVTQGDRTNLLDVLGGVPLQKVQKSSASMWLMLINSLLALFALIVIWRWRSRRRMPIGTGA
jgi:hypothetical protein